MLKTALPDQHGAVKQNTAANTRLARSFSPSLLSRDNNPDPQKAFHHSCGSRMPAYALTGRSATLADPRRGGKQFYFPSLSKFPFRFYIPHWQTASRRGQGLPRPVLRGAGPSVQRPFWYTRRRLDAALGRDAPPSTKIPSEMMERTPSICQRRP